MTVSLKERWQSGGSEFEPSFFTYFFSISCSHVYNLCFVLVKLRKGSRVHREEKFFLEGDSALKKKINNIYERGKMFNH